MGRGKNLKDLSKDVERIEKEALNRKPKNTDD